MDVLLAAEQSVRQPTPPNALGPFYRRGAPHEAVLRQAGDSGMPLRISGAVYDASGQAAQMVAKVKHTFAGPPTLQTYDAYGIP